MGRESECILPLKVYAVPSFFGGPRTVLGCFCYCSDKDMTPQREHECIFLLFSQNEEMDIHNLSDPDSHKRMGTTQGHIDHMVF